MAEWANSGIEWAVCLILTCFLFVHWRNLQSDLKTPERLVVQHLPVAPPLTETYRRASMVTFYVVLAFQFSLFVDGFSGIWASACTPILLASFSVKQVGKTLMFYLFILRLRLSYKGTMFEYNDKKLTITAWGLSIYSVILCAILVVLLSGVSNCDFDVGDPVVLIYAMLVFLQDLVFTFVFMLMFVIPLRKLIKLCEVDPSIGAARGNRDQTETTSAMTFSNETTVTQTNTAVSAEITLETGGSEPASKPKGTAANETQILWYAVVKTTILAVVTVVSTILVTLQWVATDFDLQQFDLLINCICILLMTPYYADEVFYERLCCCCIRCCAPNIPAYKESVAEYQKAWSKSGSRSSSRNTASSG